MVKNYFITTLYIKNNEIIRGRCVGYFSDLNDAIDAVKSNVGDIYEEGYYNYCVIEEIPEGIYQYDFKPKWFKWDKSVEGYVEFEEHNKIDYEIGFAIG